MKLSKLSVIITTLILTLFVSSPSFAEEVAPETPAETSAPTPVETTPAYEPPAEAMNGVGGWAVVDPNTGIVFKDNKPEKDGGFFRNMNQFRAGERESLNIQIPKTPPKPIIPEAPTVKVFTPQQISKSFVDFRAGERAPLNIKKEPTFTPEEIEQSLIDFRAGERNI